MGDFCSLADCIMLAPVVGCAEPVLTEHQLDCLLFLARAVKSDWEFKVLCNHCHVQKLLANYNDAAIAIMKHTNHFTDLFYRRKGLIGASVGWRLVGKGFRRFATWGFENGR